jgi:hypothetical protein
MEQLDKALNIKEHPDLEFVQLQNDYAGGKREFALLYKLVAKKNAQDIEHDQLTEEMLNLAPQDSASSLTFIQFLADQAPFVDSKIDKYMRKDGRNFNDAWYLMSSQKRVSINNKILYRSSTKAIREKNFMYAQRVANFKAGTYTDRMLSRKYHDKTILDYYKGVKDTSSFLSAAVKYYDQYLMNISVDSIKKVDSLRLKEMFSASMPLTGEKMMIPGSPTLVRNTTRFTPIAQYYTNELNEAAWSMYTYTHDPFYTAKALVWSERATEFFDHPGAIDTYARLLYRSGNKNDAVSWEEKSIKLYRDKKAPEAVYNKYVVVLENMKSGVPLDKY